LSDAILSTRLERASVRGVPERSAPVRAEGAERKDPAEFLLSNSPAFEEAPASNPGLDAYLQPTEIDNLSVLPSGPLPPNPAELLGSQRMAQLVGELKARADVLLFDSPPVLAVTDAAVLSTQLDGVVVVFEAGQTRRELAEKAVGELRRVGANLLGVVMNRLSRGRGGYNYYYYYYYSDDGKRKERHAPRTGWLGRLMPFGNHSSDGTGKREAPAPE
jgi:Mrp family chromosome partitioning ATPase